MDKIDNKLKQVDNVSREIKTLRKIQNEMLGINTNRKEECFGWLINRQDTAEEISELEAMTIETSKTQKLKKTKKKNPTTRQNNMNCGATIKSVMYT